MGENLRILCFSELVDAGQINLFENGAVVNDPRIQPVNSNNTHREFQLANTTKSDDGRMLVCAVSEIESVPVTVTIICKFYGRGNMEILYEA